MFNLTQKKELTKYFQMFKRDIELKEAKIDELIKSNLGTRGDESDFIVSVLDLNFKKNNDSYEIFLSAGTTFLNLFKDVYLENGKEIKAFSKKCNDYFYNYLSKLYDDRVSYNQINDDDTLITFRYDIVAFDFTRLSLWLDRNGFDQDPNIFMKPAFDLPDGNIYGEYVGHLCFIHKEGNDFTTLDVRDNKIGVESSVGGEIQENYDIIDYEKAISRFNALSGQRVPTSLTNL